MPPKRPAGSASSSLSSTPKKPKTTQLGLAAFFTSPKAKGCDDGAGKERSRQEADDEELARKLQREWDEQERARAEREAKGADQGGDQGSAEADSAPSRPSQPLPVKVKEEAGPSRLMAAPSKLGGLSKPSSSNMAPPPVDIEAMDASISSIALGDDIFLFDPTTVDASSWPRSQGSDRPTVPYALLAHAFALLSATRSRLLITTILTNMLRVIMHHEPASLLPAVYLVSNHIAPPYDGIELGLGGSIVNRAIREVTGKSPRILKQLWTKTGDPGDVAFEAKKDVKALTRPNPITVQKLFSTLHTIARTSGQGSATIKLGHVSRLLVAARGEEVRFLVRTFISHLRIQAVRTTIATVLARTFALDGPRPEAGEEESLCVDAKDREGLLANPARAKDKAEPRRAGVMEKLAKAERVVREVRARHPDFGSIVPALLEGGIDELSARVPLRVGTPLSPMLGSITRSLQDMHSKLGPRAFVSEFKYDGQRVQIHATHVPTGEEREAAETRRGLKGGKGRWVGPRKDVYVRLFSRHLEDMTDKYPDIIDLVLLLMGVQEEGSVVSPKRSVQSFIMDAEVVALGLDGTLLPFQTLANRSRKDVDIRSVKVRVGVFAFDLMYLDGQPLLKSSFRKRRRLLHERFPELVPSDPLVARFAHVRSCEENEPDAVEAFFKEAREAKCEGIMVKSLDHHWEVTPADAGKSEDAAVDGDAASQAGGEAELQQLGDEVGEDMQQADQDKADDGASLPASISLSVGKGVNGRGKALLSTYEPDKRCESWLKVKKDYVDGIGDSLDLVPIGAWHGMGRKAAWWSPILLAVYDPQLGQYQAVCKCISGFTDAEYKDMKFVRFKEDGGTCYSARNEACRDEYDSGGLLPDVWFEPKEVWEVRGADITLSPVYRAALGLVSEERGLSMRFPRFIKRRDDKKPENATTPAQLAQLYRDQNAAAGPGAVAGGRMGGGQDEVASVKGSRRVELEDGEERGEVEEALSDLEPEEPGALDTFAEEEDD